MQFKSYFINIYCKFNYIKTRKLLQENVIFKLILTIILHNACRKTKAADKNNYTFKIFDRFI